MQGHVSPAYDGLTTGATNDADVVGGDQALGTTFPVCGRLTKDLPLAYLQGGARTRSKTRASGDDSARTVQFRVFTKHMCTWVLPRKASYHPPREEGGGVAPAGADVWRQAAHGTKLLHQHLVGVHIQDP